MPAQNEYDAAVQSAGADTTPSAEYDAAVKSADERQIEPVQQAIAAGSQMEPDRRAKVLQIADSYKLDPDLVDRNLEYFQGQKKYDSAVNGADFNTLVHDRPALASWLMDRDNAAVSQDDLPIIRQVHDRIAAMYPEQDKLADLPWMTGVVGPALKNIPREFSQKLLAPLAVFQEAYRLLSGAEGEPAGWTPEGLIFSAQDLMNQQSKAQATYQSTMAQRVAQPVISMVADPSNYILPLGFAKAATADLARIAALGGKALPGVVEEAATEAKGAGAGMAVQAGAQSIQEQAQEKQAKGQRPNLSSDDILDAAAQSALAYFVGRAGGMGATMHAIKGGGATAEAFNEATLQAFLGAGQMAFSPALGSIAHDQTPDIKQMGEGAVGGAIAALPFGLLGIIGSHPESIKLARETMDAHKAIADARALAATAVNLNDTHVNEIAQDRVAGLIDSIAPDKKVFLQGEDFDKTWRSRGQDPAKIAADLTGDPEAWMKAQQSGHLEVPMAKFLTMMAKDPGFPGMLDNARVNTADGMSLAEAGQHQKDFPKKLAEMAEQMKTEAGNTQLDEFGTDIAADVEAKLIGTKLYDPAAAKTYGQQLQYLVRGVTNLFNLGAKEAGHPTISAAEYYKNLNVQIRSSQGIPEADIPPGGTVAPTKETLDASTIKLTEQEKADEAEDHKGTLAAIAKVGQAKLREYYEWAHDQLKHVKLVEAANVPYGMGMDVAGTTVFKDPQFSPRVRLKSGKEVDSIHSTMVHEIIETRLMGEGMSYEDAHHIATAVEDIDLAEHQGLTPAEVEEYQLDVQPELRSTREYTGKVPDQLNRKPYEEEGETYLLKPPKDFQQPGPKGAKGMIQFGEGATSITIMPGADLSTLLHEFNHLATRMYMELASRPEAPQMMKDDYAKWLEWAGWGTHEQRLAMEKESQTLANKSDLTPEEAARMKELDAPHEKSADGLLKYQQEGIAPSSSMRRVFAIISSWLKNIYRTFKNNVKLTPEIRGVFDRMLASEDETRSANDRLEANPVFDTPEKAGMKPDQFDAYQKRAAAERQQREDELRGKLVQGFRRQYTREFTEAYKEKRGQVLEEMNGDQVQSAISLLRDGTRPDGSAVQGPGFKIDVADLKDVDLSTLPGYGTKRRIYAEEGGIPLDEAAKLLKFGSGDEMIKKMQEAEPLDKVVKRIARERTLAERPDPLLSGEASAMAVDLAHSQARAEVMESEAKQMHKLAEDARVAKVRTEGEAKVAKLQDQVTDLKEQARIKEEGQRADAELLAQKIKEPIPQQMLKVCAQEQVGSMLVKDLRSDKYESAESKFGQQAVEHAGAKRWDKALQAQQMRQINFELAAEVRRSAAEAEKIRVDMQRYATNATRERIGKAGGYEFTVKRVDTGEPLLQKFGSEDEAKAEAAKYPGATYERTSSYLQAIDRQLDPYSFRKGKAPDGQTSYRDLTMDQLRAVSSQVKMINQQAILRNRALKDARTEVYETMRDTFAGAITANSSGPRKLRLGDDLFGQITRPVMTFLDNNKTVAAILRRMDGNQDGGQAMDGWQRKLNDCADEQAGMNAEATRAYNDMLNQHGKVGFASLGAFGLNKPEFIPEINNSMSRLARIVYTLNYGNAGNRERLLGGFNHTEEQAMAVMNGLDAKDRQLVRDIWKFIDSYWPKMQSLEERVHGFAPTKVEATPFYLGSEEMPGGYFPIKYDNRQSAAPLHESSEAKAEAMLQGAGAGYAMTDHGHLKEREGSQGRPLDLSFEVVGRHVSSVIHDLTHREVLMDLNHLLNDDKVKGPMVDHWGKGTWDQFRAQIINVAMGHERDQTGMGPMMELLRQGGNMAQRAFNVVGAFQQLAGIPNALPRLGVGNFLKAIVPAFNPAAHKVADEWSSTLARRNELHDSDLARQVDQTSSLGFLNPVRHAGMLAINTAWKVLDAHAWWGGYYKAMDITGGDHDKSVKIADQIMLDTQGGFEPKDVPKALQGGAFAKLFTNQMSWANANFNLMSSSIYQFASSKAKGPAAVRLAGDMLTYLIVGPALYMAARQALTGQDMTELEHPENMKGKLAGEAGYTVLSSLPLLREFSAIMKHGDRYEGPQGLTGIQNLYRALEGMVQGKEGTKSFRHSAVMAAGTVLGLPAAQINHSLDGWTYAEEHNLNPVIPLLTGPPPKQ